MRVCVCVCGVCVSEFERVCVCVCLYVRNKLQHKCVDMNK